jgi:hypothetical protein
VTTSDFRGQVLPEDGQLLAIGRPNMRGKPSLSSVVTPAWAKQDQVGELAGGQPREPAAVLHSPERQAPVPLETVPAQHGGLQPLAAHGLHGISVDRLYVSDFHGQAPQEDISRPETYRDWAAAPRREGVFVPQGRGSSVSLGTVRAW